MPIYGINRDTAVAIVTPLVTGLVAVWLAFEAASLTWIILDDAALPPKQAGKPVVSQQHNSEVAPSLKDITQYHLFGHEKKRTL